MGTIVDHQSDEPCRERRVDCHLQGRAVCRRIRCLCAVATYWPRWLDLVLRFGGLDVPVDRGINSGTAARGRQAIYRTLHSCTLGVVQDELSVSRDGLS